MNRAVKYAVITPILALGCLFIPTVGVQLGGQNAESSKESDPNDVIPPRSLPDNNGPATLTADEIILHRVPPDGTIVDKTLHEEYTTYRNKDGKELLHGRYRRWIKKPYMLIDDIWYSDGVKHGPYMSINPVGFLKNGAGGKEVSYFVGGWRQGESIRYRADGTIFSKSTYKNNKRDGMSVVYYKNGMVENIVSYENGKRQGMLWWYYESGARAVGAHFKDNSRDGLYETWFESGQMHIQTHYKDGSQHGSYKKWDEDGNLISHVIYENSRIVKTIVPKK